MSAVCGRYYRRLSVILVSAAAGVAVSYLYGNVWSADFDLRVGESSYGFVSCFPPWKTFLSVEWNQNFIYLRRFRLVKSVTATAKRELFNEKLQKCVTKSRHILCPAFAMRGFEMRKIWHRYLYLSFPCSFLSSFVSFFAFFCWYIISCFIFFFVSSNIFLSLSFCFLFFVLIYVFPAFAWTGFVMHKTWHRCFYLSFPCSFLSSFVSLFPFFFWYTLYFFFLFVSSNLDLSSSFCFFFSVVICFLNITCSLFFRPVFKTAQTIAIFRVTVTYIISIYLLYFLKNNNKFLTLHLPTVSDLQ